MLDNLMSQAWFFSSSLSWLGVKKKSQGSFLFITSEQNGYTGADWNREVKVRDSNALHFVQLFAFICCKQLKIERTSTDG